MSVGIKVHIRQYAVVALAVARWRWHLLLLLPALPPAAIGAVVLIVENQRGETQELPERDRERAREGGRKGAQTRTGPDPHKNLSTRECLDNWPFAIPALAMQNRQWPVSVLRASAA